MISRGLFLRRLLPIGKGTNFSRARYATDLWDDVDAQNDDDPWQKTQNTFGNPRSQFGQPVRNANFGRVNGGRL